MSKDAKPRYRVVSPDKASAETPDELAEDRMFLLRELTCAAGELPVGAIAALTDAARDLVGPKCREALIGQVVAITRGMPTYELETLIDELRKIVCPRPATRARIQLCPKSKPQGGGDRRKTRRRPSSDRSCAKECGSCKR